MSERKMGTYSARPSDTGTRHPGPVKSETDVNRPACSGFRNERGPVRWRW
jgi:hypothetical protein